MASEACCAAGKPLQHDYAPIGSLTRADDGTEIYITGTGPRSVVLITDIFGLAYNQAMLMLHGALPPLLMDNVAFFCCRSSRWQIE